MTERFRLEPLMDQRPYAVVTAYGKQDTGGASKVPLMVNQKSAVLSIFM